VTTVVGVDVGGTTVKAALVDPERPDVVLARAVLASPPDGPDAGDRVIGACATLVDQLRAAAAELRLDRPAAVGVAVPGIIDEPAGVAVYSSGFGWAGTPVRAQLGSRTDLPVAFGHDVRTAGLAEWRLGAGRGVADLLLVALGTGIGAAVVVDGAMLSARGYAGQLGHVVVDPDGPPCGCGQRGCASRLSSAKSIAERYAAATGRPPAEVDGSREVAERVRAGDAVAARVWADAMADLGTVLVSAVTLFGSERVVLAGGGSGAGDLLTAPIAEHLAAALTFQRHPEVVAAALGADAGMLGAGLRAAELLT